MPSGQPNGDRIIWDEGSERHLLMCMIADINPSNVNWGSICARFGGSLTASAASFDWVAIAAQMGGGLSKDAVSQKFAKIKKRDADIFTAGAGSVTVSTPVKSKATPKRGRSKAATATADVEDDEEEMDTPTKKAKKYTAKKEHKDSADDDEMASPVKDEPEGV